MELNMMEHVHRKIMQGLDTIFNICWSTSGELATSARSSACIGAPQYNPLTVTPNPDSEKDVQEFIYIDAIKEG